MRKFAHNLGGSRGRVACPRSGLLLFLVLTAALPGLSGEGDAPRDLAALRSRAEQGEVEAQNTLGNLYTTGQELPRNFAEALKWYQASAGKGSAVAQFNLGLVYELGRGVKADEQLAYRYYRQAAEQNFGPAQYNLGNLYAAGRVVKQDFLEAALWYKLAAEQGVVEAAYNLGLLYEAGQGVKKDEVQAARWHQLAADRGYAPARHNLDALRNGIPPNPATAETAGTSRAATADAGAAADSPAAQIRQLGDALERAQTANALLAETNRQLQLESDRLHQVSSPDDQLKAAKVKALAEKISRLETELARARPAPQPEPALPNPAGHPTRPTDEVREQQDETERLRRLASEAGSLRVMNDRLESELKRLQASSATPATAAAADRTQLEDLRHQLAVAQAATADAKMTADQLRAQLQAARENLARMEKETQRLAPTRDPTPPPAPASAPLPEKPVTAPVPVR